MANSTKSMLAASLKELMKETSLSRISVADITGRCGLNRQTFYYHFTDKYKLVNWIFDSEVMARVESFMNYDQWDKALEMTFRLVEEDNTFYLNALHDNFSFFYIHLIQTQRDIINAFIENLLSGRNITDADRNFLADFFTNAFVGTFVSWINANMHEPSDKVVSRLKKLIKGSLRKSVEDYIQ